MSNNNNNSVIEALVESYEKTPQVETIVKSIVKGEKRMIVGGLAASSAAVVISALMKQTERVMMVIMNDADEAGYMYNDMAKMMGEERVMYFPSSYRRAAKYGQKDAANEIMRTEVLTGLSLQRPMVIVSYPEAVAEKVVAQRRLNEKRVSMKVGMTIDITEMATKLKELGLTEVDYVYEPGQFARRGSLLDIYSYGSELPVRIDFCGDDIDSIRQFEVDTQLSQKKMEATEIVGDVGSADGEMDSVCSFMPEGTIVITRGMQFVAETIDNIYNEGFSRQAVAEQMKDATEMEAREMEQNAHRVLPIVNGMQFLRETADMVQMEIYKDSNERKGKKIISFDITPQPLFHKNFDLLIKAVEDYQLKGYDVAVVADSSKQNDRLKEILAGKTMRPCLFATPTLHEGFADNSMKICLMTDHQIFDRFHNFNLKAEKARGGKMALTLKEIRQFEVGDYVVHVDHGIGKFGGLVRMPQGDGYQEMIKISYLNGDSIYVSIHSLYKVAKYKAQDNGEPPRLSHLGTGQWERLKEKTKKKIKDIARDLIKLYAQRRKQRGFAFSHDSYLQHELEASFLYEDTPDQLKATNDVKADMERGMPMDRLVCGDVGFGKTEVAVRAAFKAACDGKQVAVLVPTTVLAYQHFQTFSSRLKNMPVTVEYMTRARTAKQTTQLVKDLAEGKIDILIGTQKMLGKQVAFKDLGLLIIDEEQKFGVATKEKLRKMKVNVDTLTMSATPIPRTLQFSLVGARDLSVIQTPPPNRYPIQTEVHTFSADIIAEAINFEMSRNGQVFFVNNRIGELQRIKEMIAKYVPDARVAIGHGQMKPEDMEKVIMDFANYDYDVLLSTTIVENGIDIPNANTIIINGAHYFGLSDLHQMRGRVGRGNKKAFCYLLAPPLSALNQESRRRLEAIETFSDLGSGINIAMQDLDIRGAGNLLGAEQSGFIADLGYETYQKILNQAVAELKNDEFAHLYADDEMTKDDDMSGFVDDCALESDIEMYFPDQYVPTDSERMLLYRELDNIKDDDELERFRKRLVDRFGPVPEVGEELMRVVRLRRMAKSLGCEKIMLKMGRMTMILVSNNNSAYYQSNAFDMMLSYVASNPRRCNLREANGKRSMVVSNVTTVAQAVEILETITGPKPCADI